MLTAGAVLLTLSPLALSEVQVRLVFTAVLVGLLSAALIGAPVMAAPAISPSAPIGVVISSQNNQYGVDIANSGVTIYDGDHLQTPDNGTLRARFGAEQMLLAASTDAEVHSLRGGFSARLGRGSVVVSSTEGQTFEVWADGARIRPANGEPATGQVTVMTPKELLLTVTHGAFWVSLGGATKTVEAGNTYTLDVTSADPAPGPQPGPQQPSTPGAGRMHPLIPIIIGGTLVVTGILVWRALITPSSM